MLLIAIKKWEGKGDGLSLELPQNKQVLASYGNGSFQLFVNHNPDLVVM